MILLFQSKESSSTTTTMNDTFKIEIVSVRSSSNWTTQEKSNSEFPISLSNESIFLVVWIETLTTTTKWLSGTKQNKNRRTKSFQVSRFWNLKLNINSIHFIRLQWLLLLLLLLPKQQPKEKMKKTSFRDENDEFWFNAELTELTELDQIGRLVLNCIELMNWLKLNPTESSAIDDDETKQASKRMPPFESPKRNEEENDSTGTRAKKIHSWCLFIRLKRKSFVCQQKQTNENQTKTRNQDKFR